jgi:hypothetical protein
MNTHKNTCLSANISGFRSAERIEPKGSLNAAYTGIQVLAAGRQTLSAEKAKVPLLEVAPEN